jgi:hypothetical protein
MESPSQDKAIVSGKEDFVDKALECPLCLSLICQPLSISCGHSFCRVCLVRSLRRSKKKCPQCRVHIYIYIYLCMCIYIYIYIYKYPFVVILFKAVCHITAEVAEENIMIKTLAMNFDPTEYASRLLESETEKKSWSALLPIFYYNETLFPGIYMMIHMYRYSYLYVYCSYSHEV